jgi:hypothetical protein
MREIVSKVIKGFEKEMEILLNTKTSITNWECYERVAKHYSQECFSIAKVCNTMYILMYMYVVNMNL